MIKISKAFALILCLISCCPVLNIIATEPDLINSEVTIENKNVSVGTDFLKEQRSIYAGIGEQVLKGYTKLAPKEKEIIDLGNSQQNLFGHLRKVGQNFAKLNKTKLNDLQKRDLVFRMFDEHEIGLPKLSRIMLESRVQSDLGILVGDDITRPELNLLNRIKRTSTVLGEAQLARNLIDPFRDFNTIKRRQNFLKVLVEDKELFNTLDGLLGEIGSFESDFLKIWMDIDEALRKSLEQNVFYSQPWLRWMNKRVVPMEIFGREPEVKLLVNTSVLALLVGCLYCLKYDKRFFNISKPTILASLPALSGFAAGGLVDSIDYFFGLKGEMEIFSYLQSGLIELSKLVRFCKEIENQLKGFDEFKLFDGFGDLEGLANKAAYLSDEISDLTRLLEKNTFKKSGSYYFTLRARVLVAYKKAKEVEKETVAVLKGLGELDAFLSMARLYNEHSDKPNKFTFVELVERDLPYLKIDAYWNPFLDSSRAVSNSIELGYDCKTQNAIVTGANAGGKSTNLKSIVISTILAQSYGIAPAKGMTITPFSNIQTYLNITDDIAAGLSHFKSEAKRAKEIMQGVETFKNKGFVLSVVDEMFIGTSPEKGSELSCKFMEKMISFPYNMCIFATHYPAVTLLQEKQPENVINFCVGTPIKNENGKLVYPYTLAPGIGRVNVADDIIKEEDIFKL